MVETAVNTVLSRWVENFGQGSVEGMVSLYSPQALFYGSNAELLRGKEGVRAYFTKNFARPGNSSVEFRDIVSEAVGDNHINLAGIAAFKVGSREIPMRLTFTLVRENGAWLIATHHASLTPVIEGITKKAEQAQGAS